MKVSRSRLQQIIKEEMLKVLEGIQDLDFSKASDSKETSKSKKSKSKKDEVEQGISLSDAREHARAYLRKKDKDPDVINNHRGFRNFLSDNRKTYWTSTDRDEIEEEIEYWLDTNIIDVTHISCWHNRKIIEVISVTTFKVQATFNLHKSHIVNGFPY